MKPILLASLLLVLPFAGCLDLLQGSQGEFSRPLADYDFDVPETYGDHVLADDLGWPDFSKATLRILDNGAFDPSGKAAARFEELTGATVEVTNGGDTGSALNRAIAEQGSPSFDVLYGIDNMLFQKALDANIFDPYKPQLYQRVPDSLVFFGEENTWFATPVDYGWIAPNIDVHHEEVKSRGTTMNSLFKIRDNADLYVTSDPRLSTPGLGFLIATIWVVGEDESYDWKDYWREMFVNGVLVTPDWSTAYENHFTGGYGASYTSSVSDRPGVTSYTESPAYENYYGRNVTQLARPVLDEDGGVFKQIQTMGVLKGTKNRAVAEAWIEFTLTDDFQELAAPEHAVYPVVPSISTFDVYSGLDPRAEDIPAVGFNWKEIGAKLDGWLADWVELCETYDCV